MDPLDALADKIIGDRRGVEEHNVLDSLVDRIAGPTKEVEPTRPRPGHPPLDSTAYGPPEPPGLESQIQQEYAGDPLTAFARDRAAQDVNRMWGAGYYAPGQNEKVHQSPIGPKTPLPPGAGINAIAEDPNPDLVAAYDTMIGQWEERTGRAEQARFEAARANAPVQGPYSDFPPEAVPQSERARIRQGARPPGNQLTAGGSRGPAPEATLWDQLTAGTRDRVMMYSAPIRRSISGVDPLIDETVQKETEWRVKNGLFTPAQRRNRKYVEEKVRQQLLAGAPMLSPDGIEGQGYVAATLAALEPEQVPEARGFFEKLARFGGDTGAFVAELGVMRRLISPIAKPIAGRIAEGATRAEAGMLPAEQAAAMRLKAARTAERFATGVEETMAAGAVGAAHGEDPVAAASHFAPIAASGMIPGAIPRMATQGAYFGGSAYARGADPTDVLIEGVIGPIAFNAKHVVGWAQRRARAPHLEEAMPEGSMVKKLMDRWENLGNEVAAGDRPPGAYDPEIRATANSLIRMWENSDKLTRAERNRLRDWIKDNRPENVYDFDEPTAETPEPKKKPQVKEPQEVKKQPTEIRPEDIGEGTTITTTTPEGTRTVTGTKKPPAFKTAEELSQLGMEAQRPIDTQKPSATDVTPPDTTDDTPAEQNAAEATTTLPTEDVEIDKLREASDNFHGLEGEDGGRAIAEFFRFTSHLKGKKLSELGFEQIQQLLAVARNHKIQPGGTFIRTLSDELMRRRAETSQGATGNVAIATENVTTATEPPADAPSGAITGQSESTTEVAPASDIDPALKGSVATKTATKITGEEIYVIGRHRQTGKWEVFEAYPDTPQGRSVSIQRADALRSESRSHDSFFVEDKLDRTSQPPKALIVPTRAGVEAVPQEAPTPTDTYKHPEPRYFMEVWDGEHHVVDRQKLDAYGGTMRKASIESYADEQKALDRIRWLNEGRKSEAATMEMEGAAEPDSEITRHKPGDIGRVMGTEGEVDAVWTNEELGVEAEVWTVDGEGGVVRTLDIDAGRVISIQKYPDFAQAFAAYIDFQSKNRSKEPTQPETSSIIEGGETLGDTTAIQEPAGSEQRPDETAPVGLPPTGELGQRGPGAEVSGAHGDRGEGVPEETPTGSVQESGEVGTPSSVAVPTAGDGAGSIRGAGGEGGGGVRGPRDSEGATVPDTGQPGGGSRTERPEPAATERAGAAGDYVIPVESAFELFGGGDTARIDRNLTAIETVKRIIDEDRPATDDEKRILAGYTGWGALKQIFAHLREPWKYENLRDRGNRLKELLTDEELRAANASIRNAHYTPPEVIRAMYHAIAQMGFTTGRILEPSMGVGHFFGFQPADMAKHSRRFGVEIDNISGHISRLLYPRANIQIDPYQKAAIPDGYFDVAIGNVPFGKYTVYDPNYPKHVREMIHDYFFARTADALRPGGIMAFISSHGTLDKPQATNRRYLAQKLDMIGAVRLFREAMPGTEVIVDLIFLRKRGEGEAAAGPGWMESQPRPDLTINIPDRLGVEKPDVPNVNRYFHEHPEQIIGVEDREGSLYSESEYSVAPPAELAGLLEQIKAAKKDGNASRENELRHEYSDIYEKMVRAAIERLPLAGQIKPASELLDAIRDHLENLQDTLIPSPENLPAGAFFIQDGRLLTSGGRGKAATVADADLVKQKGGAKVVDRIKSVVGIRDTLLDLYRAQRDPDREADLPGLQKRLNTLYDEYARKFKRGGKDGGPGTLHDPAIARAMFDDPYTLALVQALEKYNPVSKKATKTDIFTRRVIPPKPEERKTKDPADAVAYSINELGRIDIDRIAQIMEVDRDTATKQLIDKEVAFLAPSGELISADEYLSGNVVRKLESARAAARLDEQFDRNVKALEAVQPEPVRHVDIGVQLGAPWIPVPIVSQWINEYFQTNRRTQITVRYDRSRGKFMVEDAEAKWTARSTELGVPEMRGTVILEHALNLKIPRVVIRNRDGSTWVDEDQTLAAQGKLEEMQRAFGEWMWAAVDRRQKMEAVYNRVMNNTRHRDWKAPASYIFHGINPSFRPFQYQKDIAYRIVMSPLNTLIDATVGSGKTYTITMATAELIRLGIARKVLVVVDNATTAQFAAQARFLYPAMNIQVLDSDDLNEKNRVRGMAKIAAAENGMYIIPQSAFPSLPVRRQEIETFFRKRLDELTTALEAEQANRRARGQRGRSESQIQNAISATTTKMEELLGRNEKDRSIPMEEAGIDWIIYDESHDIKNLLYTTSMGTDVRGLGSREGAGKSLDAWMKIQMIQRIQNGRGITFSTGTPIANSMTEMFSLFRYLHPGLLAERGLDQLDPWVRSFASVEEATEATASGTYARKSRLRKWMNLPELTSIYRDFAHRIDHQEMKRQQAEAGIKVPVPVWAENSKGERDLEVIQVPQNEVQEVFMQEALAREEAIKQRGKAEPGDDIILTVLGDIRRAAVDVRMAADRAHVSTMLSDMARNYIDKGGKLYTAARIVGERYRAGTGKELKNEDGETVKVNTTTAIFFGLDTPPAGGPDRIPEHQWTGYKQLVNNLVAEGIPREEIATIWDVEGGSKKAVRAKKAELFEKVNRGEIRVIIGSYKKMGVGVNIQRLLDTYVEIDPADYRPDHHEQSQGRAIRQGNLNPEVAGYRLIGVGSSDEFMFNTMSMKQEAIYQVLSGTWGARTYDDIDPATVSLRNAMGAAASNPKVVEWLDKTSQLQRLESQYRTFRLEQDDHQRKIGPTEASIAAWRRMVERWQEADADAFAPLRETDPHHSAIVIDGKTFEKASEAGLALILKALEVTRPSGGKRVVGHYGKLEIVASQYSGRRRQQRGEESRVVTDLGLHLRHPSEGPPVEAYITQISLYEGDAPTTDDGAALTRGMSLMRKTPEQEIKTFERDIERAQEEIRVSTNALKRSFPRMDDLLQLREDVPRLNEEIQRETAPPEEQPAPPAAPERSPIQAAKPEQMQPGLTKEQMEWIRVRAAGRPTFGMGGMFNVPDNATWWQKTYDDISQRLTNLPPGLRKRVVDQLGWGIWGERWGLTEDVWREFERVKGAEALARVYSEDLGGMVDEHVRKLQETFGGGGDMRIAANTALEDSFRLTGSTRRDDLPPELRRIHDRFKDLVDEQTEDYLENTHLHPYAEAFGLLNVNDVIRLRHSGEGVYLRRLYKGRESLRGWRTPEGESYRNVGPRIRGGMFMHKRSDEQLWHVQEAPGKFRAFQDPDDAMAYYEDLIEANRKKYGESVYERIKVVDPFGEEITAELPKETDIRVLMAETLVQWSVNIQTLKLFHTLATTVARERADIIEEVGWQPRMGELELAKRAEKIGHVRLMDTPTLGPLAGMWVPLPVARNIMAVRRTNTNLLQEVWDAYIYAFKSSKVLYNLPTWWRNLFGMTYLWGLDGVKTPLWMGKAYAEMKARGPLWAKLVKEHELVVGWQQQDLDKLGEFLQTNRPLAALGRFGEWLVEQNRKVGDYYNLIDEMSKLGSYMQKVAPKSEGGEGMSHEEAVRRLWMYTNYARLGGWASKIRNAWWGAPFISFTDNMIRINLQGARDRPGRMLAMWMLPGLLSMASAAILGLTDEELDLLNQGMNRRAKGLAGGISAPIDRYFQPLLPWRDRHGRVQTLDLRWTFPLANDFRVSTGPGGIGLPHVFAMPPARILGEIMHNVDMYTGKPLTYEGDTATEAWGRVAAHVWKGAAPVPTIASRGAVRLYEAATNGSASDFVKVLVKELFGVTINAPYISRDDAFRLVKQRFGEDKAREMNQIIDLYNERYRSPWSDRIRASSVRRAYRSTQRNERRRERGE